MRRNSSAHALTTQLSVLGAGVHPFNQGRVCCGDERDFFSPCSPSESSRLPFSLYTSFILQQPIPTMSTSCCEHVMRPTSTPEGFALRVMKASDLPHVRALHVSTSLHAIFLSHQCPIASSVTSYLSPIQHHSSSSFLSTRDSSA